MDTQLNLLDLALIVILAFTGIRGFARGLVDEVAGFAGVILGVYLASQFYIPFIQHLRGFIPNPSWQPIASWCIIFVGAIVGVAVVANSLRKIFQVTSTVFINQILGSGVGLAKGIFVCAILLGLLEIFMPEAVFLKQSLIAPYLNHIIAIIREQLPDLKEAQKQIMENLPLGGLK